MTEPTDDELAKLFTEETGFDVDDFPAAILDFARAARQRWGQPSGAGEAAEHYRNAIASACEGWTMPDGLRKHLETALWSPPTPQPTQAQAGAGEVVAWRYRMKGDLQWQYTERPEQFAHADEVQPLTTPQPTQAQAGAGEVVYQASYKDGFWQDCSRERYEYLKAPKISSSVDWTSRILYTAPQPT